MAPTSLRPFVVTVSAVGLAIIAAFAVNGVCFASWLSRTPAVRDALALSPAGLGLLLVCLSGGACLALPPAGPLVHRFGAGRTVLGGALLTALDAVRDEVFGSTTG